MTSIAAFDPARLWRAYPRESVGLAVLMAAAAALAGAAWAMPTLEGAGEPAAVAPPAPPPLLIRKLAPQDALSVNQAIPLAFGPNPAARPFSMVRADGTARARAVECLASAVYYEAGQESADGQRAVAQVVLNRVRHPAFPASVCATVFQGSTRATGCQFTFTCDGSLARRPDLAGWARARAIAEAALNGYVHAPVGWATHYHADYVVPYWASSLAKNAVEGAHIFYRWSGGWGRPAAFAQAYARSEPAVDGLRAAAMLAEQRDQAGQLGEEAEAVAEIPGAERLPTMLNRKGETQVAIRFNLAAREAVEKVEHKPYVDKVEASDNLRWSLGGAAPEDKPFGKAAATGESAAADR